MSFFLVEHPLLVIAGPTASGKSALALRLARKLRENAREAEIICADSITVYRGFEIGAAKPSTAEREEFHHHLLDIADPEENFTAGDFVRLASIAISKIHERGGIPLLVGGTGFYLRALLRGMASNEQEDPDQAQKIKKRLEARAATEGWAKLYRELLSQDPGSIANVHANDYYRILRALQAMELYGRPWSELNQAARAAPWRFPGTRFFCLETDRDQLRERIDQRSEAMLQAGLLNEVKGLIDSGVPLTAKPMLSVGYKECLDTLSREEPESSLRERITQSTAKLAKQQRTWFRGESGVEWLKPDYWESLLEALRLKTNTNP